MVPLFGVYPSAFGDDEIYIAPPSFKLFSMESAEGEKSFLRCCEMKIITLMGLSLQSHGNHERDFIE